MNKWIWIAIIAVVIIVVVFFIYRKNKASKEAAAIVKSQTEGTKCPGTSVSDWVGHVGQPRSAENLTAKEQAAIMVKIKAAQAKCDKKPIPQNLTVVTKAVGSRG